jgi:ATP-dependent DNA helicase RecQ
LQRDQRRALSGHPYGDREVRAELLNSTQKTHERREITARLANGELDFLYLGPEQLTNPETARRSGTSRSSSSTRRTS